MVPHHLLEEQPVLVPPLLALGSPGTLLFRATPYVEWGCVVRRLALGGFRSWVGRWLLPPAFSVPVSLFFFYGLYLMALADRYILQQWFREDTFTAAQNDIRVDRYGDPDLDANNDYLVRLRQHDRD